MNLAEGLFRSEDDGLARCSWCQATPGYRHYHDHEWGFPVTDDRRLFEKLCLEGFQAGLSWLTILNKRENFRDAFGIVRHRGKIESTSNNAKRVLKLRRKFGSLAAYAWRHEPAEKSRPEHITWAALKAMTASADSMAMSKHLKKRGWTFVGPTRVYAFMQAMALVNDHNRDDAGQHSSLAR